MIKITTESGFCCELPKNSMDDMELVEIMAGEFPNEAFRNAKVVQHLLRDQKQNLYEHLRKIHGKVPATAVDEELRDIIRAFGNTGKNS